MNWWSDALYDTCSLITLDKILLDHVEIGAHFTTLLAVESSLSHDQMRQETADRMRPRITSQELPSVADLATILAAATLPKSIAKVDEIIYATAVHHKLSVVTADKDLAKALLKQKVKVGDMAVILQELVLSKALSQKDCTVILADLVTRRDMILGADDPTWTTLKKYTFP